MTITANITSLQKLTSTIGTSRDTQLIREQLNDLVSETREIASQTSSLLKKWNDNDKDARLVKSKLMKEYQMLLQQFGDAAKYSAEKERSNPLAAKKKEAAYPDSQSAFGGGYQDPRAQAYGYDRNAEREADFLQQQQQIDFQNLHIEERNESIKELEKSVIEINDLFIDVAKLVKESQPMIDSIEGNILDSVDATDKGVVQLRKASDYQKKSRTKLCCILVIFLIVLAVIIIGLWIGKVF
jgi:hypothetical protein